MNKVQFRVLYREFLFRIVDLEALSVHAKGDSQALLGQFVSLLVFCGICLALVAGIWASMASRLSPLMRLAGAATLEHFLIATTMLAVGLFAVLSWESTFPDKRDILVLGPLPVRARTLLLAKIAATASALGLVLAALHVLAGLAWPLALAQYESTPAPALAYDARIPPVRAADFPAVMQRDIAPMLGRLDLMATDGAAGIAIGVSEHGARRIMTYGAAKPDSMFEIGSIGKTFTGLLLARMAVSEEVNVLDPVRELLPPGVAPRPSGLEITLLDLATHHSGLPMAPDNFGENNVNYRASDLYDYLKRHGLGRPVKTEYSYSSLGYVLLGTALANRAGISYAELVRREITDPLGMQDTGIVLSTDQLSRLIPGHGYLGRRTQVVNRDTFTSLGAIRSTAGDMLTYLEAELHPESSRLAKALATSQVFRDYVTGDTRIALAWQYDPERSVFEHDGATAGFSAYAFFDPRHDFAAVVLLNSSPAAYPLAPILAEHIRQRLTGQQALSLAPFFVPPAGPLRSFFAYWVTMLSAGVFLFCCVLSLQGFAAQLLPRHWFLRASAWLQLAVFCILLSGYFLQRSPAIVLVSGERQSWIGWIPSYWFVAMYQQLSGALHPAVTPFARRAWIGLMAAVSATGLAYAASYFRTLRRIVETPDIAPGVRSEWLPRFRGLFETAIVQFSVRSMLRSRQHRMILAFYLGVAFALGILFVKAPETVSSEIGGTAWEPLSVALLAATISLLGFWVAGMRVVCSLPLDLRANWILRVMPFEAGQRCLRGRRRALLVLSVAPACALAAVVLFSLWPWRAAAAHVAVLALLGIILAEYSFEGVQKIPFTCSYLPGKSNVHLTFWLWTLLLISLITGAALNERKALENPAATAGLLGVLGIAALFVMLRNNRLARPGYAELRFEELPVDHLQTLEL